MIFFARSAFHFSKAKLSLFLKRQLTAASGNYRPLKTRRAFQIFSKFQPHVFYGVFNGKATLLGKKMLEWCIHIQKIRLCYLLTRTWIFCCSNKRPDTLKYHQVVNNKVSHCKVWNHNLQLRHLAKYWFQDEWFQMHTHCILHANWRK